MKGELEAKLYYMNKLETSFEILTLEEDERGQNNLTGTSAFLKESLHMLPYSYFYKINMETFVLYYNISHVCRTVYLLSAFLGVGIDISDFSLRGNK